MTQALRRTHFNSSRLVRFLADLAPADGHPSKQAFAQRVGQWVSFTDAMTLYTALNASAEPVRGRSSKASPAAFHAVQAEWTRVRTAMVAVINQSCSPTPGAARIKFPLPAIETGPEIAVRYAPYHRFYITLQREMDAKAGPLRTKVREALAQASPALCQLAALDAAFDAALRERERHLLSTVPQWVEKRFEQLRTAHQQSLVLIGQIDDSAVWLQPGAWLARFREDLCEVLLAQWELCLEPVAGLMTAFEKEAMDRHE